jgi:hypothetical protein
MPRVRNQGLNLEPPRVDELTRARNDEEERRKAELATTKKTQGLLRGQDPAASSVGRYSVRDVSEEYVESGANGEDVRHAEGGGGAEDRTSIPDEPITEEVPAIDASAIDAEYAAASEAEPDASRPRRSTPKQRVGHRRSTRPEMGHARERGTKRTDPGIRARTLRGGGSGLSARTTSPQLPAAKQLQQQTTPPPQLPAGVANPQLGKTMQGGFVGNRTLPLAAAKPAASVRPPPLPASTSASIVIDPSLSQPSLPVQANLTRPKASGGGYVPLPRDREAYEAFLRSAAGEHGGPPRARPSWAQQETALIPREALDVPSFEDTSERSGWPSARTRALVGVLLIALSAGVGWWILEGQSAAPKGSTPLPAAPSTPAPPARPITLIATEPTGAELLLDNAVIGNTPLEVTRPTQGESLYIVRLKGFEQQMVRINSTTHEAIHITLSPAPEPTKPATPASKR